MENQQTAVDKWGFTLPELYRLALNFYKQNSGKAIHLTYEDNLKLIAFKQQSALGSFDAAHAPELGVLDVIGRDRRMHWQMLGELSRERAMESFIDLLDTMCSAFRPYVEAVRQNRVETLKADLRRMEAETLEREQKEREQQELLQVGYKEELQRRQLQDALNKQTYQQFKVYAEKQFPGNPEQQAVLIHQLQQEHYYQYMQQLHLQQGGNSGQQSTTAEKNTTYDEASLPTVVDGKSDEAKDGDEQQQQRHDENINLHIGTSTTNIAQEKNDNNNDDDDDDYVIIQPAKIWTRPDIEAFKLDVSAGDGDGIITIGHGETVTVRVPTHLNGKCIFWEFATDSYDVGFGVFFEWMKPVNGEVTVHVSDTDDDDEDYLNDDYMSSMDDDLECGGGIAERNTMTDGDVDVGTSAGVNGGDYSSKPPVSTIVPIYRRESFREVYVGSHTYPGEGVYLLKFDNTYSIWRSKTLYYRVYYER